MKLVAPVTLVVALLGVVPLAAQEYDLVLRNGRVVDGTGAPWYRADVAVQGDTIVAVGPNLAAEGRRTIDVAGRVIAPGFIDVHTDARRGILALPTADNYVKADLVAFDPATVRDRATFEEPHAYAEGVSHVVVSGFVVVDEGRLTGVRPGRVLLGPGAVEEGGPKP